LLSDFPTRGYYSAVKDQSDSHLLQAYADQNSEPAFAELVRRYVDLVYSAALRMSADAHLAQDVTQRAFVALAKNARELSSRPVLSGWLHRTAQNITAESIRNEIRRRAREEQAAAMNTTPDPSESRWEEIAPHLDAAVGELSESDRDAVLLRYFQNKSAREMAAALGVSDEAAQKRVNRAVERLRAFFSQRGIVLGAAGLGAISANAIQAAPVSLTLSISAAALATITTGNIALQTMNWINAKTVAATLVAAIAAGGGVYLTKQKEAEHLRVENQNTLALQTNAGQEREEALASAKTMQAELERLRKEQVELLRLRGEVGQLRKQLDASKPPVRTQTSNAVKAGSSSSSGNSQAPIAWAPGTYITREMMVAAGYETPEAALQTLTAFLMSGTYDQANGALDPKLLERQSPTQTDKEAFEAGQKEATQTFKGMQIMARKQMADDKVELKVRMEGLKAPGDPTERPEIVIQVMTKVGDVWKLGGSTHPYDPKWDNEGEVVPYVK
jgi:RNA polymerase sigma factor (sigma-70 family)